jgi:hypothetical protein
MRTLEVRTLMFFSRPVKSAILATNETMVHYAKLHALMTQGSPINVRVFDNHAGLTAPIADPRSE